MTPLVLVHGFMGGSAQWEALCADLNDHVTTIAVDLPGFGANADLPPLRSIVSFANWVIQDLTRQGVGDYDLLGHSMGGMIAQEIARRDKAHVKRLILYATGAVGVLPGRFETIEVSKARAEADGATATARRIAATWFLERESASAFEGCAKIAERATLPALHAGLDAMQAWSGAETLSEIGQETLILWGDSDRTYPWEQIEMLWNTFPNTRLAVLPGCAHAVHLEKPDLFSAVLKDFLL